MFEKEIRVKRLEDVRYGTTKVEPDVTMLAITKLLRKHKCQKLGTLYSGDELKIGFELDGMPFMFEVPRVYINNRYNDKIGVRIVFRYLETILELTKSRAVSIHTLLLPMAQIRDPDDNIMKPLADVWIKRMAEGRKAPTKLLLE